MVDAARACYAARILRSPAIEPTPRFGWRARLFGITVMAALYATEHRALARTEDGVHRPRVSHRARAHQPDAPPPPPATPPDDPPATPPAEDPRTNVHLVPSGTIALPGRGLSVAWSPDGTRLAVGGHFRDKETRLRYDTRVVDVAAGALVKSFACHWFWAVSQAWVDHPDYGPLLADGGGDHAVKVWNPVRVEARRATPGSSSRPTALSSSSGRSTDGSRRSPSLPTAAGSRARVATGPCASGRCIPVRTPGA